MANEEILTDDYVARLLAQDAKESTIKYSALGMEAFAKSKPPGNKPKPNTRFLRNIIKETDSHNAALLAKEAAESKARLNSLTANKRSEQASGRLGAGDIRRRQLGDIAAILGGGSVKRRKLDSRLEKRRNTSSPEEPERSEKDRSRSRKYRDEREDETKIARSERSHRYRERSISRETRKDRERRKKERSRSRSPGRRRSNETRHRDRTPKRRRSRSIDREKPGRSHRRHLSAAKEIEAPKQRSQKPSRDAESKPDYDSDPLDDFIGPRPPKEPEVRSRGRGTISGASGIDSRFSASYDPTIDVQPDVDGDDWDQALEAMRDRQKWIQKGADRLRAAGFTEEELKKWHKGEKREEDVRWSKKGEDRAWDRGKVVGEEGVTFDLSFGRLKDD